MLSISAVHRFVKYQLHLDQGNVRITLKPYD